jgi:CHAD domain-containing protein
MLDFLPPEGMTLEQVGDELARALTVAARGERERSRTFYDTYDGLLHADGKMCVFEDERLMLIEIESGTEVAGAPAVQWRSAFGVEHLPGGPLRAALAELIDVRALLPLARVESRGRALSLLDKLDKTVVRMTLEAPSIRTQDSGLRPLRPRLCVAAVRGYEVELHELTRRLESDFGFRPIDQALVDEAVRAAGTEPGGVSAKVSVTLRRGQRTDEALSRVLLRLLEVIEANRDGAIADIDSEFLHDFRVAVRRSRSVQREFKRAFPVEPLGHFRAEFRWLQQVTGEARDLDVHVLAFDDFRVRVPLQMQGDLDPLLEVLRGRRLVAHRRMAAALSSERTEKLLAAWLELVRKLPALGGDDRPDAARPIEAVAAQRIVSVYRRMVTMGGAIDRSSPAVQYHELRKTGKELRYLLELFGAPLFPGEVVKPMVTTLKVLQAVLGRLQDREVQTAMLGSVSGELARRPDGASALMAMGALVRELREDERAARDEFAARFATFASRSKRMAVRETFR